VVAVTSARWSRLDASAIEAGTAPAPPGAVLVASSSTCVVTPGEAIRYRAFHWHLLVGGGLMAAEQSLFDGRCLEHVQREGPELPEGYVSCLRRFASEQVRRPLETADGCGVLPLAGTAPEGR
jgi:hypothetical protein